MPLKIHSDDDKQPLVAKIKSKRALAGVGKPQRKPKAKQTEEPVVEVIKPYAVLIATLGKPPKLQWHESLELLAAAVRSELQTSLAEDVRVFLFKGEQLPLTIDDGCLRLTDAEQSVLIRLPLAPADVATIQTTGELFSSNDMDVVETVDAGGNADDDFLFA